MSITHRVSPFVGVLEKDPKISLIGTLAMLVEALGEFDLVQQGRVWSLADVLSSWPNVEEAVVGVTNVMLTFVQPPDDIGALAVDIIELWHRLSPRSPNGKLIEIPVVYGGELGFDLPAVVARSGLSAREVIRIHSEGEYTVCAIASSLASAISMASILGYSCRASRCRRSTCVQVQSRSAACRPVWRCSRARTAGTQSAGPR